MISHVIAIAVLQTIIFTGGTLVDENTDIIFINRHHDNRRMSLVMSDEFNTEMRGFARGEDDMFEALEKPDDSNQAIQFYNSSREYVTTKNGSLIITTRAVKTHWTEWNKDSSQPVGMTKNYTSGKNLHSQFFSSLSFLL